MQASTQHEVKREQPVSPWPSGDDLGAAFYEKVREGAGVAC